jgi:hypothetical protein
VRKIRAAVISALAATALLAAGCSSGSGTSTSSGPSAAQIKAAMLSASSVHMSGSVTQNGKPITINLSMTRSGDLYGTMAVSQAQFTVLSTGGKSFIKLSRSFVVNVVKAPASACAVMCGKYLKLSSSESAGMLGSLSMSGLLHQMLKGSGNIHYTGKSTIDGQPVWVARDSGFVGYIAAQGKPYLLRIVGHSGAFGRIDFTQWNSVTIPPAPPASKVVDTSQL